MHRRLIEHKLYEDKHPCLNYAASSVVLRKKGMLFYFVILRILRSVHALISVF